MKKIIFCCVIIFAIHWQELYAQQLISGNYLNQNLYLINPATAGLKNDSIPVSVHYRNQWTGFTGSPKTLFLSSNGKFNDYNALGGWLAMEKIGPFNTFSGQFSYTYYTFLHPKIKMGLSLAGRFQQYALDRNYLKPDNDNDQLLNTNFKNTWTGNASFGFHLEHEYVFLGLAAPNLFKTKIKLTESKNNVEQTHYYSYIGGYIPLSRLWVVSPIFGAHFTNAAPLQFDFSAKAIYNRKYWAGINVRTGESIGAFAGLNYNKLSFGYTFEYVFNSLKFATLGSHEIMLVYQLKFKSPPSAPQNAQPTEN
jgi:type IX secretion system PorP/SprF family membrane protein